MSNFTFYYSNDLYNIENINREVVATSKTDKGARGKIADLERGLLHAATLSPMAAAFKAI